MDMAEFVTGCRTCDPTATPEKAAELLMFAAELGESIMRSRDKQRNIPYDTIVTLYNDICTGLPKAHKLSSERRRHIKSCFAQKFTLEDFEKAFRKIKDTPFLMGENDRGWHVTFDWIIKPANLLKVTEGNYGAARSKGGAPSFDLAEIMRYAQNNTPKL